MLRAPPPPPPLTAALGDIVAKLLINPLIQWARYSALTTSEKENRKFNMMYFMIMCDRVGWWWCRGSAPCSLVTWHRPCCSDSPSHYPPTSQLQQQLSPGRHHSTASAHLSNTTQLRAVTRGNLIVASTTECGQATQLLPSSNYPLHNLSSFSNHNFFIDCWSMRVSTVYVIVSPLRPLLCENIINIACTVSCTVSCTVQYHAALGQGQCNINASSQLTFNVVAASLQLQKLVQIWWWSRQDTVHNVVKVFRYYALLWTMNMVLCWHSLESSVMMMMIHDSCLLAFNIQTSPPRV